MKVNIDRLMSRIEEIYNCGKKDDGTHTRMAYSKEDLRGRELFISYAEELGLKVRTDEAGNIILRLEGSKDLPAIVTGSHLDTVPDGGKFDGVFGCLAGLEVCQVLKEANFSMNHPLEVIVFTDEEGFRFGSGLLGSAAICGEDLQISNEDMDLYGNLRKDVMASYGITIDKIKNAKRDESSIFCFIEAHIEQGASLDEQKIPIGVVTSIAGVNRYEIRIIGQNNHAGSTRMKDRKDALVLASEVISKIPEMVFEIGKEYTVATVGTIKVFPNSVNVIPGECVFSLEIRDQKKDVIEKLEERIISYLKERAESQEMVCKITKTSSHEPAPMCEWVREEIIEASKELGYPFRELPSGAFHDALIMTSKFPTAMIFVPSIGGISHSVKENTLDEDIEKGCNVLLKTILKLDSKI